MSTVPRPITLARRREDRDAPTSLADTAYARIKQSIFDFELVPGDRFSENELAESLGMSRTPVREALARLQRDGYLEVQFRAGWLVKPFDFEAFEHLYDLRMVLETTAVRRLVDGLGGKDDPDRRATDVEAIEALRRFWLVPKAERSDDWKHVAAMDEAFHVALVGAAGNPELARVHRPDVVAHHALDQRGRHASPSMRNSADRACASSPSPRASVDASRPSVRAPSRLTSISDVRFWKS